MTLAEFLMIAGKTTTFVNNRVVFLAPHIMWRYARRMTSLTLKTQELPYDHPDSVYMFQPGPDKPFVATSAAIELYQNETIVQCLRILQQEATAHSGIDYLQVFDDESKPENLWIIEDGDGGAITALLPSDY